MGLLNLINVELLTDSTGITAAERFNLYRVSSTRNLLTRDDNRDFHSVAMFGGVDYEKAQEYNEMLVSMNTRGNWAYLQNTLLEVEQINDLLKGSGIDVATLTGSFATEGAFKQLDGTQANVVHIASHGYYIPQTQRTSVPYFSNSESTANIQDELFYSGLILSGGQKAWAGSTFKPDDNDGILTAYEISKLDLHNVNLVVLSACETGLGDNLFDGIFGLQRAFKKAGVSSILMSLWKIDDRATFEYMSLFYEKLVEGYSKHDAYISTVLTMKERYPDANYWASFILLD
jgi:CHAT domain-containing protein